MADQLIYPASGCYTALHSRNVPAVSLRLQNLRSTGPETTRSRVTSAHIRAGLAPSVVPRSRPPACPKHCRARLFINDSLQRTQRADVSGACLGSTPTACVSNYRLLWGGVVAEPRPAEQTYLTCGYRELHLTSHLEGEQLSEAGSLLISRPVPVPRALGQSKELGGSAGAMPWSPCSRVSSVLPATPIPGYWHYTSQGAET